MEKTKKPDDWIAALPSEPDWAIEIKREDAGWLVKAHWWGSAGEIPSEGPREVILQLADNAAPEVRQRGMNSGVMRRLEHLVSEMASEAQELTPLASASASLAAYVSTRLEKMPAGPRDDPDAYYRGLLELHQGLLDMGHPQPLNLLSNMMSVPKDTLKTRLRKARQLRGRF